jgi:hypothetical protein
MGINRTCETCEFNFEGICANSGVYQYGEKISDPGVRCDSWSIGLEYYTKILKAAPWYLSKLLRNCKINFDDFMELLEKDMRGEPIEINLYDALEEVYGITIFQIADILGVPVTVVIYARNRGTVEKRVYDFASRLFLPTALFDKCTSLDIPTIKLSKEKLLKNGILFV